MVSHVLPCNMARMPACSPTCATNSARSPRACGSAAATTASAGNRRTGSCCGKNEAERLTHSMSLSLRHAALQVKKCQLGTAIGCNERFDVVQFVLLMSGSLLFFRVGSPIILRLGYGAHHW